MPTWFPSNLDRHFYAHPGGKDKLCWEDLLKKSPVTKEDYKAESEAVHQKAWFQYEAQKLEGQIYSPRRNYVDHRFILAAVHPHSDTFATCFHVHDRLGHVPKPFPEQAIGHLRRLRWQLNCSRIRDFRKVRFAPSPLFAQALLSELKEVELANRRAANYR